MIFTILKVSNIDSLFTLTLSCLFFSSTRKLYHCCANNKLSRQIPFEIKI